MTEEMIKKTADADIEIKKAQVALIEAQTRKENALAAEIEKRIEHI